MFAVPYAFAILLAAQAASAPAPAPAPAPGEPTLEQVKAAAERVRDVNVALAEGYIRDPSNTCEVAEMVGKPASLGTMGIHYFRPDMLGITAPPNPRVNGTSVHTDFNKPAILIYEPQADGSVQLMAVENLVFKKSWAEAGNTAPPTFHGVPWDDMEDNPQTEVDEAHHFEPHYDRHVWVFRDNPNGVFAQFNTNASCSAHNGPHDMHGTASK
jgi:hypothetical protein